MNVTPSSSGCTTSSDGTVCTIALSLKAGNYVANIAAFGGLGATGSILSQGQEEPFSIAQGVSNQVPFTLYGVPASFTITPQNDSVSGTVQAGYVVGGIWAAPRMINVVAHDASGYAIVGPGAPTISVKTSSESFGVIQPTPTTPNAIGITPPGTLPATTTITLTATPADKTTCLQAGAHCTTSFSLAYSPFANDDWVTFAHDFQRTGLQTHATGITAANVGQLTQRWE
ncbi:MAG TPA: hypothetical protein VK760_08805, partial [Candidatus Acidoferrales bacterium]|nr:hypothetical protein [Candidatus Acidoferrales bacterium]